MAGAPFLSKYSTEACNHKEVYSNSLSLTMWKIKRKKDKPPENRASARWAISNEKQKQKSPTEWGVNALQANEKENKQTPPKWGAMAREQMKSKNKNKNSPQNRGELSSSKWKKKKKNPQKNGDKCSLNSSKWKKKLNQSQKNWPSRGHGQWMRPSFSSGVVMWHCGDTWMAVGFNVVVVVHIAVVGK